jgi:hypothetical protein
VSCGADTQANGWGDHERTLVSEFEQSCGVALARRPVAGGKIKATNVARRLLISRDKSGR